MSVLLHPPLQGLTPWRLLDEAPGSRSVLRWRGAAEDGSAVDVIRPQTSGSGSPGRIRRGFARAHGAIRDGSDPALVRVLAVIEETEGVAVVREPLAEATLEAIVDPLPGDLVAAIGARLFPAVLEVGGALGGALLPSDVGLNNEGWVVLAPLGPHTSHVERSVASAVAPETFEGAEPDGRAALYGLGTLLYRLAAGRAPPTGAAPSAPSTWNHRVSPELDRAILTLLDEEPDRRPLALPELQAAAGTPQDLRALVRVEPTPRRALQSVRRTSSAGRPVAVPHGALATLDPPARSAAAGIAGIPIAAIDELLAAGLPLVIGRSSSNEAQVELVRRAREELGAQAEVPRPPRLGPVPWFLAGTGAAAVPVGIGLALIPLLGPVAAIPGAVLGAGVVGTGLYLASRAARRRAEAQAAETAWAIQERGRDERMQWPAVASVDARLARLRRDLAHADLPIAADADVRGGLKEVERRLDRMIGVLQTAERALGAVDRSRLSTRLNTLERSGDPAHKQAREQAARAAADLADIESRRDRQLAEVHELEAALDELASALSAAETEGADAEVERLQRTARLLRQRELER